MAKSKKSGQSSKPQDPVPTEGKNRRSFIAVFTGGLAMLAPIGAGIWTFLSPLFRKASSPEVRVALLDQVPDDGKPHFFPVITDRKDAWTQYDEQKVGAVYLIRDSTDDTKLTAFTAKCPHAGCSIGYSAEEETFKCPCHTSSFNIDGSRCNGDAEVAPRDMDTLVVQTRDLDTGDGQPVTEVVVKFEDFQTGHKEKKPTL